MKHKIVCFLYHLGSISAVLWCLVCVPPGLLSHTADGDRTYLFPGSRGIKHESQACFHSVFKFSLPLKIYT